MQAFDPDYFSSNIHLWSRMTDSTTWTAITQGAVGIANASVAQLQHTFRKKNEHEFDALLTPLFELFEPTVRGAQATRPQFRRALFDGLAVAFTAKAHIDNSLRRTHDHLKQLLGVGLQASLADAIKSRHFSAELVNTLFGRSTFSPEFVPTGAFRFSASSISFYGVCIDRVLPWAWEDRFAGLGE